MYTNVLQCKETTRSSKDAAATATATLAIEHPRSKVDKVYSTTTKTTTTIVRATSSTRYKAERSINGQNQF